jgi:PAS domain S-box-containing protein
VTIGWLFDIDVFRRPIPGLAAMNPTMAFTLMMLSLSLTLLHSRHRGMRLLSKGMILICLSISILRLLEAYSLSSFFVDQLLFHDKMQQVTFDGSSARVSPTEALNLALISLSLLMQAISGKYKSIPQWIALIVTLLAWFSVLGYVYHVPEFYSARNFSYHPMAIHTAVCFLFLSAAAFIARPDQGIAKIIFNPYQGSQTGRMLLPVVFIVPVLLGYIRLWGHWKVWFSTEFGVGILVTSVTLVTILVIILTVKMLNKRDLVQLRHQYKLRLNNRDFQKKNDEIGTLNEELAATNEEMTASNEELQVMNEQLQAAYEKIRQQSEIIFKQKDEQLNRVLDSSRDAIWSMDLTGKGENYMSRSAARIFGGNITEEMIKNPEIWTERVHPEDRHIREACFKELGETGATEGTYRVRMDNDEYRWLRQRSKIILDDTGKPARFEGIVADLTDYKNQEATLNQYRENLNVIFNNTIEEILLLDADGKVILFNKALENFLTQVTGTKPEIGRYLWETTAIERREAALGLFNRAKAGETLTVDATVRMDSGDVIHELRYEPVFIDNKVKYVTVISVDVTEKKKRENLLRQSETNLRAIFENTNDAFTLLDKDYNIITCNTAAQRIANNKLLPGTNIFETIPVERKKIFRDHIEKSKQGTAVSYEVKRPADGQIEYYHITISPISEKHEVIGYCITTHDQTPVKRAEAVLQKSEERFRALVENSKDIIAMTDNTGQAIYVTPGVHKITGFTPDEYLTTTPGDFLHPADHALYFRFIKEMLDYPGRLIETSFRTKHKEGYYQWMEGSGIDLTHHESIQGMVLTFRDVTQRKKSEQERTDLVGQLIEQNNDLRQFSFIASHNLRGPVASLLGLFNLLRLQQVPEESAILLQMANKAVNHLDSVIRDLSQILEMRSHRLNAKENVGIRDTITKIQVAFQLQIDRYDVELLIDTHEIDEIHTIKSYFNSILYNLISNAIKYRSPDRHLRLEITTYKSQNSIDIMVKDNGIGINLTQFQDRLFGLYQRFHPESEGRGIGLYMVKTQVQLLNGTISIASEPGVGTTFKLSFPVEE